MNMTICINVKTLNSTISTRQYMYSLFAERRHFFGEVELIGSYTAATAYTLPASFSPCTAGQMGEKDAGSGSCVTAY
jgi:hypothetical protein